MWELFLPDLVLIRLSVLDEYSDNYFLLSPKNLALSLKEESWMGVGVSRCLISSQKILEMVFESRASLKRISHGVS